MGGKKNKKSGKGRESDSVSLPHRNQDNQEAVDVCGATAAPAAPIMECEICSEKYDTEDRKPRNLACGHSFCTACCKQLYQLQRIICPKCRRSVLLKSVEGLPVNYPVLDMISSVVQMSDAAAASNNKKLSSQKKEESQESSPHAGRCLEARAEIYKHCAYCNLWLCKQCSRIDHKRPECLLTPFQDTLKEMQQSSMTKLKSTEYSMKKFSREANLYDSKLRTFTTLLDMGLDCVKREQDHLSGIRDHSQKMEQEIRDLNENRPFTDLEKGLVFIDGIEKATNMMQKWTADASIFLKGEQVSKLSKELLHTSVQMHLNHTTHTNAGVMALHNIKDVDVTLPVEMDRGRLLVHAAAVHNGAPQTGCRIVKFEHIKSCIDVSRALTFLDISLKGQKLGRVFIRLLGCTKRSQCFLMMCTGEVGPCFLNTRFHRIWWLHLPGEHVWAGDHDTGDGSGGRIPEEILCETNKLPENKTKIAVTAGLVAGRYGKSNSTIFRVYTKDSDDTIEEAAFGRVEYGFHILKDVLEVNQNITDIMISGCGVVLEP